MQAFETTTCADENGQVTVIIPEKPRGTLKVIVLFQEETDLVEPPASLVNFQDAIGSYYREYPNELRRTTSEWMAELREGEQDEEV